MEYVTGLERFLAKYYTKVKGKRVGLVTNHTGLTRDLKSNVDLFYQHPDINLVALYGPEHGVRGNARAGAKVEGGVDQITGLPVYSLYGSTKKPTPEMLADIDVLIFDIQDLGVRFYTYISTLFYCMESCAENDLSLIVLDRYNPLGRKVEGNIVKEEYRSFIGLYPIPQRHGMTVGELGQWARGEMDIDLDLEVIPLEGWQGEYFDQMEIPWIPPSPNIPQFETALAYPVTCLIEGTNLSEGRGTANPFEYIGAPWIDPYKLINRLEAKKLAGVKFRPTFFVPTFSKHQEKECGGIHLIIDERHKIDSFLTGLTILQEILRLYPEETEFLDPFKEGMKHFFDLHMGTDGVRKALLAGAESSQIVEKWNEERERFRSDREKYLLY